MGAQYALTSVIPLFLVTLAFGLSLIKKNRSGKIISMEVMIGSINESVGAVYALLLSISIFHQWCVGEELVLESLFKLPDTFLVIALYILVIFLDYIKKTFI